MLQGRQTWICSGTVQQTAMACAFGKFLGLLLSAFQSLVSKYHLESHVRTLCPGPGPRDLTATSGYLGDGFVLSFWRSFNLKASACFW